MTIRIQKEQSVELPLVTGWIFSLKTVLRSNDTVCLTDVQSQAPWLHLSALLLCNFKPILCVMYIWVCRPAPSSPNQFELSTQKEWGFKFHLDWIGLDWIQFIVIAQSTSTEATKCKESNENYSITWGERGEKKQPPDYAPRGAQCGSIWWWCCDDDVVMMWIHSVWESVMFTVYPGTFTVNNMQVKWH